MSKRHVGFVLLLLAAYLITPVEEGRAATKKSGGSKPDRMMWNLKEAKAARMMPPTSPTTPILDLNSDVTMAFAGVPGNPGAPIPTHSSMMVFEPNVEGHHDACSFDVFADLPPVGAYPINSFFDVFVDITAPDGGPRGQASILSIAPSVGGSEFLAELLVQAPGQLPWVHSLIVEANPDQPGLSLASVDLVQNSALPLTANSFFDVFVELTYDGSSPLDLNQPLFWVTNSALVPEPTTILGSLLGTAGILLMRKRAG